MSKMFVTYLERPWEDEDYNKYDGYNNKYILHNGFMWHLGRFPEFEKLKAFMDLAGLKMKLEETKHCKRGGEFKRWSIDCDLDDHNHFWSLSELPREVKPFMGMSNGSLVTCYLYNDGKCLHIYRPNPNAKEVYKPLPLDEHIKFHRKNGCV